MHVIPFQVQGTTFKLHLDSDLTYKVISVMYTPKKKQKNNLMLKEGRPLSFKHVMSFKVCTCFGKINTKFWIYLEKFSAVLYIWLCLWLSHSLSRETEGMTKAFFKLQPLPFTISRHTSQTPVNKSTFFVFYFLPALKSMLQSSESTEEKEWP